MSSGHLRPGAPALIVGPLDHAMSSSRALYDRYGCHPIWQFLDAIHVPIGFARRSWRDAMDLPGAFRMGHLRRLVESRPTSHRVPDQSLLADARTGVDHLRATRDTQGRFAMIYAPCGKPFTVCLPRLGATGAKAWWFNPRTAEATPLGEFDAQHVREFTPPPSVWPGDYVLVLDHVVHDYPAPAAARSQFSEPPSQLAEIPS